MNKKEAREILLEIAMSLGTTGIECYSTKDGDKMIEAINVLYYGEDTYSSFQESLDFGLTKEQVVKLDKDLYDLSQNVKVKGGK